MSYYLTTGPYACERPAGGVEVGTFSTVKFRDETTVYNNVTAWTAPSADAANADWSRVQCLNYQTST